jgi:hypothetical protein
MLILVATIAGIVLATVSISRGDETQAEFPAPSDSTEPITGLPLLPLKGFEQPGRDPFAPYDVGDPNATWEYEDLTADERAVADRGLDEDQTAVQDGYASAAKELGIRAKAESAAIQLGVDMPLEAIGVIGEEAP